MSGQRAYPLEVVIKALQASWASDTCFDATQWSGANPARGQCVVSSLVMQDYFGGDLRRYRVRADGLSETHYCNVLPDGIVIDVTASQYEKPAIFEVSPVDLGAFATIRQKRLADADTRSRYKLLRERVERHVLPSSL